MMLLRAGGRSTLGAVGTYSLAHYRILEVDPSASMGEIRRSYLKLARESHPDFHTASEADRVEAEERMRKINAAWAVLGDVDERSAYDRARLSGPGRPPSHAGGRAQNPEPRMWAPFDTGEPEAFDEGTDRPITTSALPSWLKTLPALGVLFGLAALMIGSLVNIGSIATIGFFTFIISLLLFAAAPLVALSLSKGQDRRP
jgi:DnaJ-like protein